MLTPTAAGLGQSGNQAEAARQEVLKALCGAAQRGGRLAIALVTSVATPYNAADHAAVCSLVAHFGAGVLKRALLVFSHGDVLSTDGATLSDYLADAPPDLQVRCCCGEYCAVGNICHHAVAVAVHIYQERMAVAV